VPKRARRFIAHSSRDRAFVNQLARVLDAHNLPYWYSERHIIGAQQWHDEIGRGLAACNWLLLVLSPAAVRAKWVKSEVLFALDSDAYRDHIVVLEYRRGAKYKKLSWTLKQYQWVHFHKGLDAGFTDLLRIWGRTYTGRSRRGPSTRAASRRGARRRRPR
jgi:hypothetical protein